MKILAAAFGDPRSETTFSGVPKYLFTALANKGVEINYHSTKSVDLLDIARGAVAFSKTFSYGRPGISSRWLWRRSTVDKLSRRLSRTIAKSDNLDAVL